MATRMIKIIKFQFHVKLFLQINIETLVHQKISAVDEVLDWVNVFHTEKCTCPS